MYLELTKIARKLSKMGKIKEAEQVFDIAEQMDYTVAAKDDDFDSESEPKPEVDLYDVINNSDLEDIAEILLDNLDEEKIFDLIKMLKDNIY